MDSQQQDHRVGEGGGGQLPSAVGPAPAPAAGADATAARADVPSSPPPRAGSFAGVTIALLCMGIGLLASCFLIPQADLNRRLHFESQKLAQDLAYLERRAEANQTFIERLAHDPVLIERLAQRQMKFVRKGAAVLDVGDGPSDDGPSPASLTYVPPPPPLIEPHPPGGRFADACRDPQKRLYIIGAALLLMACGLVLGAR